MRKLLPKLHRPTQEPRPTEIALQVYSEEEMILRDYLALDRTVMSNDQSLLAFLRTSLTFSAAGLTVIHLERTNIPAAIGGGVLVLFGLAILVVGFIRYRHTAMVLDKVKALGQNRAQSAGVEHEIDG